MRVINLMCVISLCFLGEVTAASDTAPVAGESSAISRAIDLYSQAVPMERASPQRGDLLDQAEDILKRVIEENPKSIDAHRKLMGVYLAKQDYRQAISVMQDAITLSPEDPKLFVTLAFLYEHSGALSYSKAMLNQALSLDPNHQLARDYLLVIEQKINKRNFEHMHGQEAMGAAHGASMTGAHHSKVSKE